MSRTAPKLSVRRAGPVRPGATVRHVDQLSDGAREALASMAGGEPRRAPGLEPGEVVVSVRYYRVVRAERAERIGGRIESEEAGAATDGGRPTAGRR
ncbi:hypothetical protein [Halorarum halobium]|uniref:hypothetical protein n=1 Tax=Halorarum halobium TaxID=3075121 RepID=UPI0028A7D047|nr:hypothetical protein [Halobaculum sp. XH14]